MHCIASCAALCKVPLFFYGAFLQREQRKFSNAFLPLRRCSFVFCRVRVQRVVSMHPQNTHTHTHTATRQARRALALRPIMCLLSFLWGGALASQPLPLA